jgi:hypothetical protein
MNLGQLDLSWLSSPRSPVSTLFNYIRAQYGFIYLDVLLYFYNNCARPHLAYHNWPSASCTVPWGSMDPSRDGVGYPRYSQTLVMKAITYN